MTLDDFSLLAREFLPLNERMEGAIVARLREILSRDEDNCRDAYVILEENAAVYCAALLQEVWALRARSAQIDAARVALEQAVANAAAVLTELGGAKATGPACERREPPDYHACGRRPVVARTTVATPWGMCEPCRAELLGRPGFETLELV